MYLGAFLACFSRVRIIFHFDSEILASENSWSENLGCEFFFQCQCFHSEKLAIERESQVGTSQALE